MCIVHCHILQREITNLKRLCAEKGAMEEEVAACKPRRRSMPTRFLTVSLSLIVFPQRPGRAVVPARQLHIICAFHSSLSREYVNSYCIRLDWINL